MPHSFDWIVFDAVGTLIYPDPPVQDVYADVGRRCGSHLSRDTIRTRFRQAYQDAFPSCLPRSASCADTSESDEYTRWRQIVRDVFREVVVPEEDFEKLFEHFGRPSSWRLYDDVPPTLSELAESGFQLAIASNFDGRLDAVCDGLPCLKSISLRIISSQVGHRKPSHSFYQAVIDGTGAAPDRLLMVGDDFSHDVQAARCAGLSAVHLCRTVPASEKCLPDLRKLSTWLRTSFDRSGS